MLSSNFYCSLNTSVNFNNPTGVFERCDQTDMCSFWVAENSVLDYSTISWDKDPALVNSDCAFPDFVLSITYKCMP